MPDYSQSSDEKPKDGVRTTVTPTDDSSSMRSSKPGGVRSLLHAMKPSSSAKPPFVPASKEVTDRLWPDIRAWNASRDGAAAAYSRYRRAGRTSTDTYWEAYSNAKTKHSEHDELLKNDFLFIQNGELATWAQVQKVAMQELKHFSDYNAMKEVAVLWNSAASDMKHEAYLTERQKRMGEQ